MNMASLLISSAFSLLFVICSLQTAVAAGNKGLGQQCTYDAECMEEHAYCDAAGTGCECKAGYIKSMNKTKCLSVEGIFDLGAKCEEDGQCSFTDTASTCKGGECRACADNTVPCGDPTGCALHDIDGRCWKSKKLGERCQSNEECWSESDTNKSRKCETICICAQETETDKCNQMGKAETANSENGASTTALSAFWAVLAVLLASPSGIRF